MRVVDDDYLTVKETATLLRVAPGTVRRWIREGDVPAYHLGPRRVALRRSDVASLITPIRADTGRLSRMSGDHLIGRMTGDHATRRDGLTAEKKQRGMEAFERARTLREEMTSRRDGKLLPPSGEILNDLRDERTRQLTGQ